jgi:hypothetical protein
MTTLAPRCAIPRAVAKPIPAVAPVTMQTRSPIGPFIETTAVPGANFLAVLSPMGKVSSQPIGLLRVLAPLGLRVQTIDQAVQVLKPKHLIHHSVFFQHRLVAVQSLVGWLVHHLGPQFPYSGI